MLRFTLTERALHWGFAFGYLLLLVSGLPLMIPALRDVIRGYTPVVGLRLHLVGAVLWVGLSLAIVAVGERRRLRKTGRQLAGLSRDDAAWLLGFPRWLSSAHQRARLDRSVGRFNAGQKVNAVFTAGTSALLLVTGLALCPVNVKGTTLGSLLTGPDSIEYWRHVHRWITVLALGPLAGHIFLAVVHPSTRPSLSGMVTGHVDAAWARSHYPRWSGEEGDDAPGR